MYSRRALGWLQRDIPVSVMCPAELVGDRSQLTEPQKSLHHSVYPGVLVLGDLQLPETEGLNGGRAGNEHDGEDLASRVTHAVRSVPYGEAKYF